MNQVKGTSPRFLCHLSDLAATGAKEIVFEQNGARVSVLVVGHGDQVLGYVNACPHARLPLNWRADMFFDLSRRYLLCANHGAHFDIATGKCMRGPCKDRSLTPFPVCVQSDGAITAAR